MIYVINEMTFVRVVAVLFLIKLISCEETLERESRGIDSKGFATLIEIGRLVANFGVDNLEHNVKDFFQFISKNIFIFYYLILGTIVIHMVSFVMILFAVRVKDPKKEPTLRYDPEVYADITSQSSFCTVNLETNDRQYWPAKESYV